MIQFRSKEGDMFDPVRGQIELWRAGSFSGKTSHIQHPLRRVLYHE